VKLPRRWVERTFAWLGRYRRNSRDYERFAESSEAMIKISSIHRMLRLLRPDQSKEPVPFDFRNQAGPRRGRGAERSSQTAGQHPDPVKIWTRVGWGGPPPRSEADCVWCLEPENEPGPEATPTPTWGRGDEDPTDQPADFFGSVPRCGGLDFQTNPRTRPRSLQLLCLQ
jgi:hypothetical protein